MELKYIIYNEITIQIMVVYTVILMWEIKYKEIQHASSVK